MSIPSSYPAIQEALLEALSARGGALTTTEAYPAVTAKFPELTPADLLEKTSTGAPKWINRIQFARAQLVAQGLLDGSQRGIWKLASQPVAPPDTKPPVAEPPTGADPPSFDSIPQLIEQLLVASHDSKNPTTFEELIRDAFGVLGFNVEQIGGSGDTDVLVKAMLGEDDFRAVIDCKTTGKDTVANSAINWPAIDDHRKKHNAQYAAVVATSFASGNLVKFAGDFDVRLIDISMLTEILRLHEKSAFTLRELEPLFSMAPAKAVETLRAASRSQQSKVGIAKQVLELMEVWAITRPEILPIDAASLRAVLLNNTTDPTIAAVTLEELSEILNVLTFEPIGVLRKNSQGAYALATSVGGARRRLRALADSI